MVRCKFCTFRELNKAYKKKDFYVERNIGRNNQNLFKNTGEFHI